MTNELDFSEFGSEEDLRGFDYPAAGTYHLAITGVDDAPVGVDAIKVTFEILAGTVDNQAGKSFTETFWMPSESSKDGGKFAKKRLARFGIASGVIDPAALGRRVQIDWQDACGRQIVAKLNNYARDGKDGKHYKGAEINGLDIWSVAAPEVDAIPKDTEALAMAAPTAVAAGKPGTGHPAAAAAKPDPYGNL